MSAHLPYSMVGAALPVVLKDGSLSECENARAGSTKARFRVRLNDINQLGEDREKRIRCSRVLYKEVRAIKLKEIRTTTLE